MVTRKLLTPLLVELGLRWESRKGSIAEEHFFAFYLRNKLGARFHHRARNGDGPQILIAGLPVPGRAVTRPSSKTTAPRRIVVTGQPVTDHPSKGV